MLVDSVLSWPEIDQGKLFLFIKQGFWSWIGQPSTKSKKEVFVHVFVFFTSLCLCLFHITKPLNSRLCNWYNKKNINCTVLLIKYWKTRKLFPTCVNKQWLKMSSDYGVPLEKNLFHVEYINFHLIVCHFSMAWNILFHWLPWWGHGIFLLTLKCQLRFVNK